MKIGEGSKERKDTDAAGLTWRGLASRLGRKDRRRLALRLPVAGHRWEFGEKGNPASDGRGG